MIYSLCVKRRESILRELFRATLAFRRTKSRNAANPSEDSFLEKNNILESVDAPKRLVLSHILDS